MLCQPVWTMHTSLKTTSCSSICYFKPTLKSDLVFIAIQLEKLNLTKGVRMQIAVLEKEHIFLSSSSPYKLAEYRQTYDRENRVEMFLRCMQVFALLPIKVRKYLKEDPVRSIDWQQYFFNIVVVMIEIIDWLEEWINFHQHLSCSKGLENTEPLLQVMHHAEY